MGLKNSKGIMQVPNLKVSFLASNMKREHNTIQFGIIQKISILVTKVSGKNILISLGKHSEIVYHNVL